MTFDEVLEKALTIFPNATLGEDNEGQLVVYTNLYPDPDKLENSTLEYEEYTE